MTSYITAYAPLLAVFVAIGVALMQYYLQKQQLKQDLYDKRFRVFYAIQKGSCPKSVIDDNHFRSNELWCGGLRAISPRGG